MTEKTFFFRVLLLSTFLFVCFSLLKNNTEVANNYVCATKEDRSDRIGCWERTVESLMKEEGADEALELLQSVKRTDLMFSSDCHVYAHLIGEISYWKYVKDGDFSVGDEAKLCDYGFYHGFMQEMGHHDPGFFESAPKLCNLLTSKIGTDDHEYALNQCYHGIGHGLTYHYVDEFSEKELEITARGVDYCKKIIPSGERNVDCMSGVYGGISSLYFGSHGYDWVMRDNNPFWICDFQQNIYKESCFVSLVPAVFSHWEFDISKAFQAVESIRDLNYARESFYYSGILLSHKIIIQIATKEEVINFCQKLKRGLSPYCIEGIGGGIKHYSLASNGDEKAIDFCTTSILTPLERKYCFKGLKRMPDLAKEEDVVNFCNKVDEENREYCQNEKY